ncbi:MAG: hypothetical protein HY074_01115 [Deltaproteobacteria bacterium]|nr:hypothetical protein [Deltaproteobacteria bacterium]
MKKYSVALAVVAGLALNLAENPAHAMAGKRITQAEMNAACTQAATEGFTQWKQPNWHKISRSLPDHNLVLPVNFVAYNEKGWLSGELDEGSAQMYLEQLRDTYRGCGIDVELHSLKFVAGPTFLNSLDLNSEELTHLSDKERCLFTPLHVDGEVNVYFVEGVGSKLSVGRSHAWLQAYMNPEKNGDSRFIGAAVVTTFDRSSFSKAHPYVVPHEVGHLVLNTGHVSTYNLMADSAEKLSYYLTGEQCELARSSPFLRSRDSLGALPALAAGRRGD